MRSGFAANAASVLGLGLRAAFLRLQRLGEELVRTGRGRRPLDQPLELLCRQLRRDETQVVEHIDVARVRAERTVEAHVGGVQLTPLDVNAGDEHVSVRLAGMLLEVRVGEIQRARRVSGGQSAGRLGQPRLGLDHHRGRLSTGIRGPYWSEAGDPETHEQRARPGKHRAVGTVPPR